MWHEVPSMNSRLNEIPNRNQLLWTLHRVKIGERNVRRQTSNKEIGRFLGIFVFSVAVLVFFFIV